jgi:hypothetical protein
MKMGTIKGQYAADDSFFIVYKNLSDGRLSIDPYKYKTALFAEEQGKNIQKCAIQTGKEIEFMIVAFSMPPLESDFTSRYGSAYHDCSIFPYFEEHLKICDEWKKEHKDIEMQDNKKIEEALKLF